MRILIPTPAGEAAATVTPAAPAGPARALLALGHGAGGGIEAADLRALAEALPQGNHAFAAPKSAPLTPAELLEQLTAGAADWLLSLPELTARQ